MKNREELSRIVDKYGKDYLLRQLAEECTELAQASLKLVRSMKGETPVSQEEAYSQFLEEIADVCVMMDFTEAELLSTDDICTISRIMSKKIDRMIERMLGEPRYERQED